MRLVRVRQSRDVGVDDLLRLESCEDSFQSQGPD